MSDYNTASGMCNAAASPLLWEALVRYMAVNRTLYFWTEWGIRMPSFRWGESLGQGRHCSSPFPQLSKTDRVLPHCCRIVRLSIADVVGHWNELVTKWGATFSRLWQLQSLVNLLGHRAWSAAGMASDGSCAPGPGVGSQLMVEGVAGAAAQDAPAKPTFMHLPMRLRNPRAVGLSHQGARTSNPVQVPEVHIDQREAEEDSDSVTPEGHGNTFQDDNARPRFAHLPQHVRDPRGARAARATEEVSVDHHPVSADQAEFSATGEANHEPRFSHLPRLHNPRGVTVVKQIQERMKEESGRQVRDEAGDEI